MHFGRVPDTAVLNFDVDESIERPRQMYADSPISGPCRYGHRYSHFARLRRGEIMLSKISKWSPGTDKVDSLTTTVETYPFCDAVYMVKR